MSQHNFARPLPLISAHRAAILAFVTTLSFVLIFARVAIAQPVDRGNLVPRIGVNLDALNDNNRARYNIPPNISAGVVVTAVAPNTDAAAKLKPGDVITQIGFDKISTLESILPLFNLLLSQGKTSAALLVASVHPANKQAILIEFRNISFLTKTQAEASAQYLTSPAAQGASPQAGASQAPDPTLSFLCSGNDLASCDKLLATPLSQQARESVLELQRKAIAFLTPGFNGQLAACRNGDKARCDDLPNHPLAPHRLADIQEAERGRLEKVQQDQRQREQYPANLAACERYDLSACNQISPTPLFVPATGISKSLDEASTKIARFNAAFASAQTFQNYVRDCSAKKRAACTWALAMPNITSADRDRIVQMQAALPWFDLDDPTHFTIALIIFPILGVLLFIVLSLRFPAMRLQRVRPGAAAGAGHAANSSPRLSIRSRIARLIDPSLQPAASQSTLKSDNQSAQVPPGMGEMAEAASRPRDPETARKALTLAHSYLDEIPEELTSEISDAPELAGQFRSTLALAAKQLDIAQDADPTQKLLIESEDEAPVSVSQQRLRAHLIELEALTWCVENPRRLILLLTQATQIDPTLASAFRSLGYAHFLNRNRTAAIAALEQALALDPDNIEIIKLLDRARNISDAEIATYKLSNVAAKTASAGIKTWHGMKLAGAAAVVLIPLFVISSFTGSIGQAFAIVLIGPPFLWLFSRVVRFIGR